MILFAALLCGCANTAQTETYPEIKGHILWFDFEQADSVHDVGDIPSWLRAPTYAETDYLDDPELQSAVAELQLEYPLDTDEAVTAYAWELYDIFDISYLDPQYIGHYYDGYAPTLYVSALDGHIIEFTSNDA